MGKGSVYFSRKAWWLASESRDTPKIVTPAFP